MSSNQPESSAELKYGAVFIPGKEFKPVHYTPPREVYPEYQKLLHRPEFLMHTGNIVDHVKDIVQDLTTNPAVFDENVQYLIDLLNASPEAEGYAFAIAELIVQWSIQQANFRYSGAKMAYYLSYPHQISFEFRSQIFASLNEECGTIDGLLDNRSQVNYERLQGVLLFLAELYLNMTNPRYCENGLLIDERDEFLRSLLKNTILKILEHSKDDSPFVSIGRVLKLTGSALDENDRYDNNSSHLNQTDRIYTHVKAISEDPNTMEVVRSLYKRVLNLRANGWISEESTSAPTHDSTNYPLNLENPVFYLQDGTPIPSHESDFFEDEIDELDECFSEALTVNESGDSNAYKLDENDEVNEAYEEFLRTLKPEHLQNGSK